MEDGLKPGKPNELGESNRLNLGCGERHLAGYTNVDKFGRVDLRHDLETFPWPWEDDTIDEVVLNHVLEHLGESVATYLRIIQELYRVCRGGAKVHVIVPHPRHDDFLNDPTHVRAITPDGLTLFSKSLNVERRDNGCADSALGLYLDVDFELRSVTYELDDAWKRKSETEGLAEEAVFDAARNFNNVFREIRMMLEVVK